MNLTDNDLLVFSIAPRWIDKIVDGSKTYELRRRGPAKLIPESRALLYATSPACAVVAYVNLLGIRRGNPKELWNLIGLASGCSQAEFFEYFHKCEIGSAIHIGEVKVLDNPIGLPALKKKNWRPPFSWCRVPKDHFLRVVGG